MKKLFAIIMSGLLLMLKRPFRLGNVVEVGGVIGKVSDIGISSTVVRTFDEKEVVIPNSELLEKDKFVEVCIDKKQMGMGCVNSWGAIPEKDYLLPYQDYEMSFFLTPTLQSIWTE